MIRSPIYLSKHALQRLGCYPLSAKETASGLRAFSLVEITLALGIVGFCLLVMLGLMSSGLTMSRDAVDRTVSAQIAQRLIGMAQQTDWSRLDTLTENYYYFDSEGTPLDSDDLKHSVYSAYIMIQGDVAFPAKDTATANDRLATLKVRIVKDPNRALRGTPEETLPDISLQNQSTDFPAFVSSNGA